MIIEERTIGAVTVLSIKGKITLGEGDELLKQRLEGLIARDRKQIVLDLGDTRYVDSSGFGEIFRGFTTVVRAGGNLVLCNLTKRITDLLTITKMISVSEVYDSVDEAVQRFQATTFEIACPVCSPTRWLYHPGHAGTAICPVCDVKISFPASTVADRNPSEPGLGKPVPIYELSWRTYATEGDAADEVRLTAGEPTVITIKGRLDLFAFEVVETAWQAVRLKSSVLFDATAVTASSPAGWEKLKALCAARNGNKRAAILVQADAGVTGGTVFVDRRCAIAELGGRSPGSFRLETTIRRRLGGSGLFGPHGT